MTKQEEILINKTRQSIVEEALRYISLGFSVIPLGSITKDTNGKKIIEYPKDGWKKYQSAIAIPEEVKSWQCENLGIATGGVSSLLVLDTDSYKENFNTELLKSFNLPITPVQETASGGKQYFFKIPDGLTIKNAVCIGTIDSGIDIRGDGGMVIVAPSKTPYGEYKWLISPISEPLADIPPKLLEMLMKSAVSGSKIRKTLPELVGLNEGEGRDNAMTSFVGKLLAITPEKKWDDEILPVMQKVNRTYNPPLTDGDLFRIYTSIAKSETEKRHKFNTKYSTDLETDPDALVKNNLRETLQKDRNQGIWAIAEYLINLKNIKTIGNRDNTKDIYLYKDGVYKIDYGTIKREILSITRELAGSRTREEIMKAIKEETYTDRVKFDVDPHLINLKNGIYDIKNNELIPHDPKYLFLHQIPVAYDKNSECPNIKKILNEILDDEFVGVVEEWFGYCLYRNYFIKKAIIFLGDRDTGKTTLLKLLWKFLGLENTSGVNLQKLSSDKFALSNLFQKHANIYDDLSFQDINDNGTFKMLTGGGTVTGEKKFGDQFLFNNYAKLTFSCNKIPSIKDTDDDAYFGRWILIRFEHKFDRPDKFLFEKISTDAELSGLLNVALSGLSRLLENQDFNYKKTPEEIKKDMCMSASSLAQFVYSQLEITSDPKAYITKDMMDQEFIKFTIKNSLPAGMTKEALGKKLPKFIKIRSGKKSIKNEENGKIEQINCWISVKFKDTNLNHLAEDPIIKSDLFNNPP